MLVVRVQIKLRYRTADKLAKFRSSWTSAQVSIRKRP